MSSNNFNPQSKIFYRPIDAALRWCNLIRYEAQIVQAAWPCPEKLRFLFPQWPCLQANTDKIYDAIRNGELPYGCFGISVPLGTPVEPTLLTVRHSDLRLWMQIHYPDQHPDFLFGSSDDTQGKISLGVYFALQAERDALLRERNALQHQLRDVEADLQVLGLEQESLKRLVKTQGQLSERSEHTYLQIIGALVNTVLDASPAGKPLSAFKNQAAIVDALTARHNDIPGLSKRTLDAKFAAANRALKKST
ncbi:MULTISPECIES: hypothetical protein [Pseudomonas]|uniref:hypothetical protein n=1 Tax=Pseudomonas TaxID=286 RepID=UPI0009C019C1|nr:MULTISPECIES: hypothetical protein [Pseudomonas]AZD67476.1 hypothetical protein C4K17_3590 [Pseudomonas chlororaphis subsp. aurantiaca]PWY40439.1 hypothetical protein DK261_18265 [Pseudomonas sp. RW409]QIT23449.1 hypothetical protein HCN09_17525 [Pseudomonas chlororaphis subsp. aurantiaca]WDH01539.1 hypothetical protein PUP57_18645 [Pseudomonas chlororaphis]WDH09613.1 hypothetical protein PUP64_28365 [Pseudomonas chlororaphis]